MEYLIEIKKHLLFYGNTIVSNVEDYDGLQDFIKNHDIEVDSSTPNRPFTVLKCRNKLELEMEELKQIRDYDAKRAEKIIKRRRKSKK